MRTIWSFFRLDTREQFPALTGIRAIAAFMVFFYHYTPSEKAIGTPLWAFLREGHAGVTLFYVLSGFLIAWNYLEKSADRSTRFWGPYMLKRVARIYPLYLLLLFAYYAPLFNPDPAPPQSEVFLNITLLKGFFNDYMFSGIAQAWSLTVEETFYLSAPLLFVLVLKWGVARTQAALWGIGLVLLAIGTHLQFYGFFGNARFVILFTFFGRSFEFLVGISCARWLLARKNSLPAPKWGRCTYVGFVGAILTIVWMSTLREPNSFGVYQPLGMALNNLVLPVFIGFFFLGLVLERSVISWVLSTRLFLLLGRSSYAFYLVHLGLFSTLVSRLIKTHSMDLRVLLLFIGMNIVAILLYVVYEHPVNGMVKQFGRTVLSIGTQPAPEKQYTVLGNRAAATFAVALLGFGFWTVATTPSQKLRLPSAPALEKPISASTQYGTVTSQPHSLPGLLCTVGGVSICAEEFIFAHANSLVEYDLQPGKWKGLTFSMGIDDAGGKIGKVVYIVKGDDKVLFQSKVVRSMTSPPQPTAVNISGVGRLALQIAAAGDGFGYDQAYWIEPRLQSASPASPPPASPPPGIHLPSAAALEKPVRASTQYGTVTSQPHSLPNLLCTVGGVNICEKEFIFAHANSVLEYDLAPGKWRGLTFSMGIDDAGGKIGSVVYIAKGDGKVLFQSGVVRSMSPPQPMAVDISGVKRLVLQVTDAGNGNSYDQAYWIEPRLQPLPPQKR